MLQYCFKITIEFIYEKPLIIATTILFSTSVLADTAVIG